MTKKQAIQIAAAYFKNHTVNEFFVTSDEQVFFEKVAAENHASGLPKNSNTVHNVSRVEAEQKGTNDVYSDLIEAKLNPATEEPSTEEQLTEEQPDDGTLANSAPAIKKTVGRPKKDQN